MKIPVIKYDGSVSTVEGSQELIGQLANGTSLQGDTENTYAELVAKLGEPNTEGDGYKTDAEWVVLTTQGIATIYNYKTGKNYNGDEGQATKDITDWHIGGHDKFVVGCVKKALGQSNE
jgi:hypothetical protein